jgi:hypothetical protein
MSFRFVGAVYQDAKDQALSSPEGVACTGRYVVVADTGHARLLTYTLREGGTVAFASEVKLRQLTSPVRVQVDSKGNVLALDRKSGRIVRVDAGGGFGGFVDLKGTAVTPAVVAFKLDAADNLYVVDMASGKLLVSDLAGTVKRTLDLPKGSMIMDVAVDVGGVVYVVDGVGATLWSAAKDATAFAPLGKSLKDRMSFASYLTAYQGKLVLVDQNGMGLVLLGVDGSYLGRQLALGSGEGSLYYPSQLCINESGDSFIADRGNNRIQQFTTAK